MAETDNFLKSSFGWLELVNYSANPTDTDSTRRGLAFIGGTLKYWNGSSWATLSGAGGASTWDEIYDNDKTLSVDDGTLTILLPTGETHNALTLQAQATATGALLAFTNAGTGNDITGTSSTWSVTKAGAATFASVVAASVTAASNLTLEATGAGTIGIGATSSGDITLGAGGGSVVITNGLTISGTADANKLTITAGDFLMSNGKIALTNDDTDTALAITANSITSGSVISVTANGVTSGNMINLVTTAAGFSGGTFIACNDGSVRFSVGVDGATLIASGVNSTKALEITGIQTSENMVTLTSSGVTATAKGILTINSSGASASGSAQIRIAPSGSPVEGSTGIKFVGGTKVMQAMDIDCDSVSNSCVLINGGGALASGKSVLQVTADGTPASGAIFANLDFSAATMTNNPIGLQIKTAVSTGASLNIVSTATSSTGVITVTNAEATDGTLLKLAAVEATLTTGKYFVCYDGAAADFSIAKYGATVIAGNASGTPALTLTAGDLVISSGTFSVSGLATLTAGIAAKVIFAGTETIAAGGTSTALNLSKTVHYIDADAGGDTFTLADGVEGQIMVLVMASATGTATITPPNFRGGTSVTFNAAGDSVILQFVASKWTVIGGNSYAIV